MKPFNIQYALSGKKVVTKNGKEVTQLTALKLAGCLKLVGVIDGDKIYTWYDNGRTWLDAENGFDLFMATEKKTMYIAVADDDAGNKFNLRLTSNAYYSKDELKEQAGRGIVMSEPHQIVSFEIEV